jgi:hypothetical protein
MNKKKQNKIYSFYLFNKDAIRIKAVLPKKTRTSHLTKNSQNTKCSIISSIHDQLLYDDDDDGE